MDFKSCYKRFYTLKANSSTYWYNASPNRIAELKGEYHNNSFYLVIYKENYSERDYYVIPFALIENHFKNEYLHIGENPKDYKVRWIGHIYDGCMFQVDGAVNKGVKPVNVSNYYCRKDLLQK
ncbi:MAG: hypothetical protein WBZ29_14290 [Methanocella sp.]